MKPCTLHNEIMNKPKLWIFEARSCIRARDVSVNHSTFTLALIWMNIHFRPVRNRRVPGLPGWLCNFIIHPRTQTWNAKLPKSTRQARHAAIRTGLKCMFIQINANVNVEWLTLTSRARMQDLASKIHSFGLFIISYAECKVSFYYCCSLILEVGLNTSQIMSKALPTASHSQEPAAFHSRLADLGSRTRKLMLTSKGE